MDIGSHQAAYATAPMKVPIKDPCVLGAHIPGCRRPEGKGTCKASMVFIASHVSLESPQPYKYLLEGFDLSGVLLRPLTFGHSSHKLSISSVIPPECR